MSRHTDLKRRILAMHEASCHRLQRLILTYGRRAPFDQGKALLLSHLPKSDEVVEYTSHSGDSYELVLSDHVMREIYQRDVYERNTMRHLLRAAEPTDTFVDVGANIGAYTIPLSRMLTAGRVVSFEPNPPTLRRLVENVERNRAKNVSIHGVGLSDASEAAILRGASLTTASIHKNETSAVHSEIQLTTLDDFCKEHDIATVNLLKIDIEGNEWKCIDGAERTIASNPDLLMILEIDENAVAAGHSKAALFNKAINLGFSAFLPRGFPLSAQPISELPDDHTDNIIFLKGPRASRFASRKATAWRRRWAPTRCQQTASEVAPRL